MWRGVDVRRLLGVNAKELLRISDGYRATGIAIGVDETRLWAMLKIRCRALDNTLWLPHETSLRMANTCMSVARDCGWTYEGMDNDQPEIELADWDCIDANRVGPIAIGVLGDAAVIATTFMRSPGTVMAFRVPASLVAFTGALLHAIFSATR